MSSNIKVIVRWDDDDGNSVQVPIAFRDGISTTYLVAAIADLAGATTPEPKRRIDTTK